jgi:hypothetical protein
MQVVQECYVKEKKAPTQVIPNAPSLPVRRHTESSRTPPLSAGGRRDPACSVNREDALSHGVLLRISVAVMDNAEMRREPRCEKKKGRVFTRPAGTFPRFEVSAELLCLRLGGRSGR